MEATPESQNEGGGRASEGRRRQRIRLINGDPAGGTGSADLLPLAACDCDNDNATTKVQVCVGDVKADVNACGVWG